MTPGIRDSGGQTQSPNRRTHHFQTVDAMRGIGALIVLSFHYFWGATQLFTNATYGVDFFFCLSGVILIHSYEHRINSGMSFRAYAKSRLIRLYPCFALGIILSFLLMMGYFLYQPVPGFRTIDYQLSAVLGLFAIPYPNHGVFPFVGDRMVTGPIFPGNIPAWSLFFEFLTSGALYIVVKTRVRLMYLIVPAFFAWLLMFAYFRNENIGWGTTNFIGGFPRAALMFFLGSLMYRWLRENPRRLSVPPWTLLVFFAVPLIVPLLFQNPLLRLAQVGLLFLYAPTAVLLGITVDEGGKRYRSFIYLGRISYCLYATHWPVYHLLALALSGWPAAHWLLDAPIVFGFTAGLIAIAVAHLLTVYVDEPVRHWLGRHASAAPRQLKVA
jgi:peptidoglycan/LPS O-acetylase OafA/YrhL